MSNKSFLRTRVLGFTLLELLVVISIIGILTAIGAASFSVAQRQARNARRRADLKAVQNALEQCKATSAMQTYAGCATFTNGTIASTAYNLSVSNPGGGSTYAYTNPTAISQTNYKFCAPLETTPSESFCIQALQ